MDHASAASGLTVSRLGLGCMGMSEFYGPSEETECLATLARALELGVTFLDTADMYGRGENERLLGRFLKGRREQATLATKCGIVRGATPADQRRDTSPAYIKAACDASLERLGVDRIDLFYLHRLDAVTPVEDSMGALADLHRQGKIGAAGLSEVSAETLKRANSAFPVAAVHSEYSLTTRGGEVEAVIDACAETGTLFVAFSPLGRGLLSGAHRSRAAFEGMDFRRILPRFQEGALQANLALVDRLEEVARSMGASPAQVALAYVMHRAPQVTAIPGTRRISRLEENISGAALVLPDTVIAELETIFAPEAVVGERYPAALAARPS